MGANIDTLFETANKKLYWLLVAEDMKPWLSAMVPSVAQQFFA